ncbi:uncharacterized protein H6S33_006520 [Morchella sextelata]|uniref:uncharacterized protein n=1 Tax=Morchella sextelata TaxID=1174677 RepID=UPI001D048FC7|nr:uncharacterized protein H6S33_006520 [Morchella sextelata]KAH0604852.1 hypothetical protein H6S33_006520 [Morchella sextelata]
MIINLEIRHDTATAIITASPDDSSLISTLIPLIQPQLTLPPTKWDLSFGSTRLLPSRSLISYGIHDGATLWVRPRTHSLDAGIYPLTLLFKKAGSQHTIQLALSTNYTVDQVKRELRAVLGETRSTGFCLYRKKDETKRRDVERGVEVGAEEEMRRGVEMEGGRTLGQCGVLDGEVVVWGFDRSVRREARRKARRAGEKARERVKGLREKYKGKNARVRDTDGGGNEGGAQVVNEVEEEEGWAADEGESEGSDSDTSAN